MGERTKRRLAFLINLFFWVVWLLIGILTGRLLLRFLLPFLAAFLLATVLQKPLRWVETRWRWSHGFAATVLSVLTLCLLGGILFLIVWQSLSGAWRLLQNPETLAYLESVGNRLREIGGLLVVKLSAFLPSAFSDVLKHGLSTLNDTVARLFSTVVSSFSASSLSFASRVLPRWLLSTLFFILSAVFFTRDHDSIIAFLRRQIPPPQLPLAVAAVRAAKTTFCGILRAYGLLGLITAGELCIGFWICGYRYALPLAIAVAVVDALPILGVGTVLLPLAAFYLFSGNLPLGIGIAVLYAVVATVRNILQPHLFSKQTGLPPLLTLLTMYVGWRAAGFWGLLLTPMGAIVIIRLQKQGYLHLFK